MKCIREHNNIICGALCGNVYYSISGARMHVTSKLVYFLQHLINCINIAVIVSSLAPDLHRGRREQIIFRGNRPSVFTQCAVTYR